MTDEDPIIVVPYDPEWPREFARLGAQIRRATGAGVLRIDHVGSTAVVGLDAKPVIDVQLSVPDVDSEATVRVPLEAIGCAYQPSNVDRTQRFFREPPGERRAHLHVRRAGSFDEQLNLLFRDFLRSHAEAASRYGAAKYELATRFRNDRSGYVRAKGPVVWALLEEAHDWAQASGWQPGPSDA